MLKKILLCLMLVAILVVTGCMVLSSGPLMTAAIPLAAATVACPIVKYVMKAKAPTPKLLCGIPENVCTLLVSVSRGLERIVSTVTKIPIYIRCTMESFRYEFASGSRFLSTRLNI